MPSWTPKMREEFKARRGYDLTPFLPTWALREIGSAAESEKFRADFRRTISDLYRDVDFEVSRQKAHAAGLRIQSEPYGGPWNVAEVVPKFDQVAGEFWNRGGKYGPYAVADVVAGTRLAGRNIINAEAFTAGPGREPLERDARSRIKPLGDAAYCDGVNRLMLHRFTHEPWNDRYKPGMVMGQWGRISTARKRGGSRARPGSNTCSAARPCCSGGKSPPRPTVAAPSPAAGRGSRAFTAPTARPTSSS